MGFRRTGWRAVCLLAAAAAAGGCRPAPSPSVAPMPAEFLQPPPLSQEPPDAQLVRRDYRLRPGDFLEIIYHVHHRPNRHGPLCNAHPFRDATS